MWWSELKIWSKVCITCRSYNLIWLIFVVAFIQNMPPPWSYTPLYLDWIVLALFTLYCLLPLLSVSIVTICNTADSSIWICSLNSWHDGISFNTVKVVWMVVHSRLPDRVPARHFPPFTVDSHFLAGGKACSHFPQWKSCISGGLIHFGGGT